ncbi:MAG: hypothetical protein NZ850_01420 [Caldimicrobium sp.]|nr:hypothetical protein [Caldimicrobium sp.]
MFIYNATKDTLDNYKMSLKEALDLAIMMKVLPKFHGTKQKLEEPIRELLELFWKKSSQGKVPKEVLDPKSMPIFRGSKLKVDNLDVNTDYPHTVKKLIEILYKLKTQGFASFM